mmetsp:Transcript_31090/g.53191  ORF Transcript_31090/g.53191 Transcript_31090/m.53191 type:complete len:461 (+) Transcript_31090:189-1571(+)
MGAMGSQPPSSSVSDLVDALALGGARLEVLVARGRLGQRELAIDGDVELAALEPAEDLVGAHEQLVARGDVVEELGPRHEGRLLDQAEDREGGHRARGVAKGDEDAAPRERADRDVDGRLADAVDDRLAPLAARDLHHLAHDVLGLVVLERLARHLVEHDELVALSGEADVLLALGDGADRLVPLEPGHLRRPLAGASADAVDEHPLARLDQVRVRARGEVVRGQALRHDRRRDAEVDTVGHGEQLGRRHGRVLAVGAEDGISDRLPDREARGGGGGRHLDDRARALLAADEGERLRVRGAHRGALAEVGVDEVDARVLVLHEDLPVGQLGRRVVGLVAKHLRPAILSDDDRLHRRRDGRHVAAAASKAGGRASPRGVELVALGREQLPERGLRLDRRLEGVVPAGRPRVLDELFLDNDLDLLAAVRLIVHLLRDRGRDAHDAVLVADDGVTRAHDHAAA